MGMGIKEVWLAMVMGLFRDAENLLNLDCGNVWANMWTYCKLRTMYSKWISFMVCGL